MALNASKGETLPLATGEEKLWVTTASTDMRGFEDCMKSERLEDFFHAVSGLHFSVPGPGPQNKRFAMQQPNLSMVSWL